MSKRLDTLSKLVEYRDYRELDWQATALALAKLEDERIQLEASSDVLKDLIKSLSALEASLASTD